MLRITDMFSDADEQAGSPDHWVRGPGGWLGAAGSPRVGPFDAFRVVPIELRDEAVNLATGEAAA